MFNILYRCCLAAALVALLGRPATDGAQSGSIKGAVVDAETGEAPIGANVIIEGTSISTTIGRHSD